MATLTGRQRLPERCLAAVSEPMRDLANEAGDNHQHDGRHEGEQDKDQTVRAGGFLQAADEVVAGRRRHAADQHEHQQTANPELHAAAGSFGIGRRRGGGHAQSRSMLAIVCVALCVLVWPQRPISVD